MRHPIVWFNYMRRMSLTQGARGNIIEDTDSIKSGLISAVHQGSYNGHD